MIAYIDIKLFRTVKTSLFLLIANYFQREIIEKYHKQEELETDPFTAEVQSNS